MYRETFTIEAEAVLKSVDSKFDFGSDTPIILCVDDEKIILDSLKIQFNNYFEDGCQIELAESAEEALEIIEDLQSSGEGVPQVIISDQIMPGMKGDEFLAKVNDKCKDSLKILLTGQADKEHIIAAINKARLYRYIAKPWDQMDLNLTVKEAILSYMRNREVEHHRDQLLMLNQTLEHKVTERTKELAREKERSEGLLLNILPESIMNELKDKNEVEPKHYDLATIAFIDIAGFTKQSAQLTPREMVNQLNFIFNIFDDIVDKYDLEKIKTLGDGYMIAGGIPEANSDNPHRVTEACLDIIEEIENIKESKIYSRLPKWDVRIGINSGELIAGVIGKNKFAYDVWGHTVNIASRIESRGEPGKVNISGNTYRYIKDSFNCIERGMISIKNMGEIDMYFVEPNLPA